MAEVIRMPKMSDTMEEGVIAQWLKKVGDEVKSGDILAEVETDKATMELESYEDGVLLHIGIREKESAPVDGVIAIIGQKGESVEELLKEVGAQKVSPSEQEQDVIPPDEAQTVDEASSNDTQVDSSGIKATVITMPKMSDTMTEGTIIGWHKKVGDSVKSGDILAEVETDKATMELESYEDGVVLYVGVAEGESVAVDGVLAIVGEKNADFETLLATQKSKAAEVVHPTDSESATLPVSAPVATVSTDTSAAPTQEGSAQRIIASPLARKMAQEKGLDIALIKGTGDNGRIIKKDVEAFVPAKADPEPGATPAPISIPHVVGEEDFDERPLSQMRKTIAKRLSESKFTSPHFYLTMEFNMDKVIEARKSMNEVALVKISFNDIILKAVATALRSHPKVNSSWLEDRIRTNHHIHIGVAVAVEEGLLVPVIRFADIKTLSHISAEVKEMARKAQNKELQPSDWEGNTFTISNLGMYGIEEFTAIINPPDACILAVGGIKQVPMLIDGQITPGNIMKVTMSCDHRVVDGATGSQFLQTLKQLIEDPVRILV